MLYTPSYKNILKKSASENCEKLNPRLVFFPGWSITPAQVCCLSLKLDRKLDSIAPVSTLFLACLVHILIKRSFGLPDLKDNNESRQQIRDSPNRRSAIVLKDCRSLIDKLKIMSSLL